MKDYGNEKATPAAVKNAKRRGKGYDDKRRDVASFHAHTATREDEVAEKIRQGLGVFIENGELKTLKTGNFIIIDVPSAGFGGDELGALMTTVNFFKRTPALTLNGRYQAISGRDELVSASCEIGSFMKICASRGVEVSERIHEWALETQAKAGAVKE